MNNLIYNFNVVIKCSEFISLVKLKSLNTSVCNHVILSATKKSLKDAISLIHDKPLRFRSYDDKHKRILHINYPNTPYIHRVLIEKKTYNFKKNNK